MSAKADSFSLNASVREVRPAYCGPTRNVASSDGIGNRGETARYALKEGLRRAVAFIYVAAVRAGARCIARVNQRYNYASALGLILDKLAKLIERPRVVLPPLALPDRYPGADAREVLKGDASSGVFSPSNDALGNNVIGMSGKSGFLAASLLQQAFRRLRVLGLKARSELRMTFAETVQVSTGVDLTIRIRRYVDDTKVNAKEAVRLIRVWLRGVYNQRKVELSITQNQVRLSDFSVQPRRLISPDSGWNRLPPLGRPYRDPVWPFPRQNAVVIYDSAAWPEDVQSAPVGLVGLGHLGNGPYRHLSGKPESLSDFIVAQSVNIELPERPALKGQLRYMVARGIEALHRLQKSLMLLLIRSQFYHQGLLHLKHYRARLSTSQEKTCGFLCRLNPTVSAAQQ